MKKSNIQKVVQFRACTDTDIAEAILALAQPLIAACGNDRIMLEMVIMLCVEGWNFSLYPETDETYREKIQKKLIDGLPDDKKQVFIAFVEQVIQKKLAQYNDMKKGITGHTLSVDGDDISLTVTTLPVNPKDA